MKDRTSFAAIFALSAAAAVPVTFLVRGEVPDIGAAAYAGKAFEAEKFARLGDFLTKLAGDLTRPTEDCVAKRIVTATDGSPDIAEYVNKCDRAINVAYQELHAARNEPAGVSVNGQDLIVAKGAHVSGRSVSGSNFQPVAPGAVIARAEHGSRLTDLPTSISISACFAPERPSGLFVKTCEPPHKTLIDDTRGVIVPASPLYKPR